MLGVPPGELAATACLLVATIALGVASNHWELVGPFVAAVVLAPFLSGVLGRKVPLVGYGVAFVPFALGARLYEVEGTSGLGFGPPFYVALYLVLCAIITLLAPREPRRIEKVLFVAASALSTCGADIRPKPRFLWFVVAFAPFFVVALRACVARATGIDPARPVRRGPKLVLLGVAFLATAGVTAGASALVDRFYEDVSRVLIHGFQKIPLAQSKGFSGEGRLGSVVGFAAEHGQNVTVRAFGEKEPGYLRGRSFVTYDKGAWSPAPMWAQLRPTALDDGTGLGRVRLPGKPDPARGRTRDLSIHPGDGLGAHFFLPLAASVVDTTSDHVWLYQGAALESRYTSTESGYDVYLDPNAPGSQSLDVDYLALPEDPEVLAAIDGLIAKLVRRDSSSAWAVAALRNFFAQNYEYRYGIDFDRSSDPIVQWLTKKKHGHCELFATAGTLALRRMKIPARYVTGFLCSEKLEPGTWVARARHAHAWIEYSDEKGHWSTAELTPAAGMPSFEPPQGGDALLERLKAWWARLRETLAREGLLGLIASLVRSFGSWVGGAWWRVGILAGLVGAPFGRRLLAWRRRKRPPEERSARILPPDLASAREKLVALERSLAKRDLGRGEAETLEEWAMRLGSSGGVPDRELAVAFIRDYARRRYEPFA